MAPALGSGGQEGHMVQRTYVQQPNLTAGMGDNITKYSVLKQVYKLDS